MADDGHRDVWSAPTRGWPTFGLDGKRLPDDELEALVLPEAIPVSVE